MQLIKSRLEEQNTRLDGQVAELTGKLETVQSELETTLDTFKKTQAELNPVQIELESERTTSQQHESARATAVGQVTDLKNKLAQLEASHRAKLKKESENFEARFASLNEHTNNVTKEKQDATRMVRKLERRIKELTVQIEAKKQNVLNLKRSLVQGDNRHTKLRKEVELLEEQYTREKCARRNAERAMEGQTS